jgi:uncharacterized membrane protein
MDLKSVWLNRLEAMAEKNDAVAHVLNKYKHKYGNDFAMVSIKEIIALVCVCLVIAYVLPTGLQALGAINTTGMSAGEIALIGAFGIIIVLVIFAKIADF